MTWRPTPVAAASPAGWLRPALLAALALWATLRLMKHMGMGCARTVCEAERYGDGLSLFLAALALALVGRAFWSVPRSAARQRPPPELFTALATGLVVLMAYVYLRSLFNHLLLDIPLSRPEFLGLLALAAGLLLYSERAAPATAPVVAPARLPFASLVAPPVPPVAPTAPVVPPGAQAARLLIDLMLLLALCVIVASRELPREVMLSSDPDVHTFFGRQIERFGAVPFHQRAWGPQPFNYPAGSGVTLYVWGLLSGLDPRGLLVVLPFLFTFIGALVVVDAVPVEPAALARRAGLQLAAIALTAAGLTFPLYIHYAHLEGAARQMSILPSALFMAYAVSQFRRGPEAAGGLVVLPALTVFVLLVLNPANVVIPATLLLAIWVHGLMHRRPWPVAPGILLAGLSLALLEPYYHALLGIVKHARIDTVIYDDRLAIKTGAQVVDGALASWLEGYPKILSEFAVLFADPGWPVFLGAFALAGGLLWLVRGAHRPSRAGVVAVLVFLAALFVVYGFARSLMDDRRFFLLSPYIFFNMSQYKALLLVFTLALLLAQVARWRLGLLWTGLLAVLLVTPLKTVVRDSQEMYLAPRRDYCGVYGCLPESDRRLLERFERMVASGDFRRGEGGPPKVLVPNGIKRTEVETWILPVTSSRVLPHYDVLPVAFYYFQGDLEYGTASYLARVCDRLDRRWLKAKGIEYLFLPSVRTDACVAGLETLPQTEQVVLREGDAYLLKLR